MRSESVERRARIFSRLSDNRRSPCPRPVNRNLTLLLIRFQPIPPHAVFMQAAERAVQNAVSGDCVKGNVELGYLLHCAERGNGWSGRGCAVNLFHESGWV